MEFSARVTVTDRSPIGGYMKKFLTRSEVDAILQRDKNERMPTFDEIKCIRLEVEKVERERGLVKDSLPVEEIIIILNRLGLSHVKLYTEDEVKGNR
jgi:hypothetical protein